MKSYLIKTRSKSISKPKSMRNAQPTIIYTIYMKKYLIYRIVFLKQMMFSNGFRMR